MTEVGGRLQIRVRRQRNGLAADIRSSRPVAASRVFAGTGVVETASALPRLFSICANAQAAACALACEGALGLQAPARVRTVRGLLTDAETVREHLWRVLLDWPHVLGEAADGPGMAAVMAAFARLRSALAGGGDPFQPGAADAEPAIGAALECVEELARIGAERVFGLAPGVWRARLRDAGALRAWARETDTAAARLVRHVDAWGWSGLGRSPVPALPDLPARELEARLAGTDADGFAAAPLWRGGAAESSPYTRNLGQALVADLGRGCHNGLLPRLAAQLAELALLLSGLTGRLQVLASGPGLPASTPSEVSPLPAGVGIAQVPAARGLLIHRVATRGERIADYRVLAPTEWNFHPMGPVATGLAGLPAMDDDQLRRFAGLFVIAVDPCVDYTLEIG
jgi:hypothetical protein